MAIRAPDGAKKQGSHKFYGNIQLDLHSPLYVRRLKESVMESDISVLMFNNEQVFVQSNKERYKSRQGCLLWDWT